MSQWNPGRGEEKVILCICSITTAVPSGLVTLKASKEVLGGYPMSTSYLHILLRN